MPSFRLCTCGRWRATIRGAMLRHLIFGAAFGLASAAAHADIYILVEDNGAIRFSNTPDDPRYKLFLREPTDESTKSSGPRNGRQYWQQAPSTRKPARGARSLYENPLLAARPYGDQVLEAARAYQLDPALVHAVIAAESNYNPNAVSGKGAVGLMQLMPDTARRYGVTDKELRRPEKNIDAGTRY